MKTMILINLLVNVIQANINEDYIASEHRYDLPGFSVQVEEDYSLTLYDKSKKKVGIYMNNKERLQELLEQVSKLNKDNVYENKWKLEKVFSEVIEIADEMRYMIDYMDIDELYDFIGKQLNDLRLDIVQDILSEIEVDESYYLCDYYNNVENLTVDNVSNIIDDMIYELQDN